VVVLLPQKVKERRILRSERPIKIKLQGQTPARFAIDILTEKNIFFTESEKNRRILDLNLELSRESSKKPIQYILSPLRISSSELPSHSLGKAKVLIGAKQATGEWKSKSLVFSGPLELSGDTALGPGRRLEIKWRGEQANEALHGQISVGWDKSEYNVKVPYLGGEIIAHLKDETGDVIGEAKIPLGNPLGLVELANAPIILRPVRKTLGFYDFNKLTAGDKEGARLSPKLDLAHAESDGQKPMHEGDYVTKSLSLGSSTFIRAEAEGFSSMVTLVSDHHQMDIPLFSKKTDKSYRFWLAEMMQEPVSNLHLGKVVNQGKAQAGVEVAVETDRPHQIIYLNEFYIPDLKLRTTTRNGYFIIVNLESGLYNLTIKGLGQRLAYSQFIMDHESHSYGEHLIAFQPQKKRVKVFDLFSGLEESAYFTAFSNPQSQLISGVASYQFDYNSIGQTIFSVSPVSEEYLKVTVLSHLENKSVSIPLVSALWFNEFLVFNRVTFTHDSAFVIGYFFDEVADLEAPFLPGIDKILYFNSQGQRVGGPEIGVGFVILDIPPEKPQIIIRSRVDGTSDSEVFSLEPGEILLIQ